MSVECEPDNMISGPTHGDRAGRKFADLPTQIIRWTRVAVTRRARATPRSAGRRVQAPTPRHSSAGTVPMPGGPRSRWVRGTPQRLQSRPWPHATARPHSNRRRTSTATSSIELNAEDDRRQHRCDQPRRAHVGVQLATTPAASASRTSTRSLRRSQSSRPRNGGRRTQAYSSPCAERSARWRSRPRDRQDRRRCGSA